MLIAVEGCCHGELDKIYETLAYIEKEHGQKVDLLLCCGDFQAIRNLYDLECMSSPEKYLQMGTFYKYYSGQKPAPVTTIFVGGNHEASNHLQELPYGGWVAPNIYYVGTAGVVNFGGLRIAGASGIYKTESYQKSHYEAPPYNHSDKHTVYHVRELEMFRLKQISRPLDIFMSHDWPVGVTDFGDTGKLFQERSDFRVQALRGRLGCPAFFDVMRTLQPKYWFAAHMHVHFTASVPHGGDATTKFLALSKCVPGHHFLQIVDIPSDPDAELSISLDAEWLGILKDTNHLWDVDGRVDGAAFSGSNSSYRQTPEKLAAIAASLGSDLTVSPEEFHRTAPTHAADWGDGLIAAVRATMVEQGAPMPAKTSYPNPQTARLCNGLGLVDPLAELLKIKSRH